MGEKLPLDVIPFRLPLTRDQFCTALADGRGRVLLHAQRQGATGFDDLILAACLHNQAYDAQCEGSRSAWLVEIMETAGVLEALAPRILQGWDDVDADDYWSQTQLCELAVAFARRGADAFRDRLYAAFRRREHGADLVAADQIVELDGADGLLFVAEHAGQWLLDDPEDWYDVPMAYFDHLHGEGAADRILCAAAEQNPAIRAYFDDELADRADASASGPRFDPQTWSADDVIAEIRGTDPAANRHRFRYRWWGRQASEPELCQVAQAMFAEQDSRRVYLYLYVFQYCGLPELDPRLLMLAESEAEEVRWAAIRVLANHADPTVRQLAVERLRAGRTGDSELRLLRHNYQPGDWNWLRGAVQLPDDRDDLHDVTMDLLDVFEAHEAPETGDALLAVYEHTPCSCCREQAVKALLGRTQLPDWVRDECRFDANEGIRQLVRGDADA